MIHHFVISPVTEAKVGEPDRWQCYQDQQIIADHNSILFSDGGFGSKAVVMLHQGWQGGAWHDVHDHMACISGLLKELRLHYQIPIQNDAYITGCIPEYQLINFMFTVSVIWNISQTDSSNITECC